MRPHGVRGEVAVEPWSDNPDRFAPASRLSARSSAGGTEAAPGRPLTVAASRRHGGRLLVAFEGIGDRDAAEDLRGAILEVPADAIPAPVEEGTFYHFQLVGCRVLDAREGDLGQVVDVVEDGGGVLLVVEEPGDGSGGRGVRRIPVPFARALVRAVDVDARRIEVELPEGLVETCASRS